MSLIVWFNLDIIAFVLLCMAFWFKVLQWVYSVGCCCDRSKVKQD